MLQAATRVAGCARQTQKPKFATAKRAERELSTSVVKEMNPLIQNLDAEITEISSNSRMSDKINSNKRSGVQINMDAAIPRNPKTKIQTNHVRDHIMNKLGASPKQKFSSPRRPEERGSSFHDVLSSG